MKFMFDALESSFIVSFFLTNLVSPQNTGAIFLRFSREWDVERESRAKQEEKLKERLFYAG